MNSIKAIREDLDELYVEAKYIFEAWMKEVATREVRRIQSRNRKEKTNYQLALEFHGNSFRIRWLRVQFIKNNERIIRVSKPLAVPKNFRYSTAKFKYV